ncbi:MAG: hypothetical protein LBU65_15400 [Planctomycetaceae bacterium]|nr:hypothetical protein [Planctomycetaceae bacterium]
MSYSSSVGFCLDNRDLKGRKFRYWNRIPSKQAMIETRARIHELTNDNLPKNVKANVHSSCMKGRVGINWCTKRRECTK